MFTFLTLLCSANALAPMDLARPFPPAAMPTLSLGAAELPSLQGPPTPKDGTKLVSPSATQGFPVGHAAGLHMDLSDDGRFVCYVSAAANLVPGDTNEKADVFVYDCHTGVTKRMSVDTCGVEGDHESGWPSISGDGRYVVFQSQATNLDKQYPGAPDNQCFVRDRDVSNSGVFDLPGNTKTFAIGRPPSGWRNGQWTANPDISRNGRYIAFSATAQLTSVPGNGYQDIFVFDMQHDPQLPWDDWTKVSVDASGLEGNDISMVPRISDDGRFVCFASRATNLAPPPDLNQTFDVFVHDRDVDGNGRFDEPGGIRTLRISNNAQDAAANGMSHYPAISGNGRFIAYESEATDLVPSDTDSALDVVLFDRDADENGIFDERPPQGSVETILVSFSKFGAPTAGKSRTPRISSDGSSIAFLSEERLDEIDFVPIISKHRDCYLYRRLTGQLHLVSLAYSGTQPGNLSSGVDTIAPAIDADGTWIAYPTTATNLIEGIVNKDVGVAVATPMPHETPRLTIFRLLAGQTASFRVENATPLGKVAVMYSLSTGSGTFNLGPCQAVCLGLGRPLNLVAPPASADAAGTVRFPVGVPRKAVGRLVRFRAVDFGRCEPSNLCSARARL